MAAAAIHRLSCWMLLLILSGVTKILVLGEPLSEAKVRET
jgi:hypothetical protein